MPRILIFFPTYNEIRNVAPLIREIRAQVPAADILAVDDASPDHTGSFLDEISRELDCLTVIHRPRKLGIGSAHKLAMHFAMEKQYDILVTMDADFSHHPKHLPTLLELLEDHDFVTGSRYTQGGRSDYGLVRTVFSQAANIVARTALGLQLRENTTAFRGFRVGLLRRMNLDAIKSEGYSFFVETLYHLSRVTRRLVEFPIHFQNRRTGKSKISEIEIYRAVLMVLRLLVVRLTHNRLLPPLDAIPVTAAPVVCKNCKGVYHTELYPARGELDAEEKAAVFACSGCTVRKHRQVLQCLQCGLVFLKPALTGREIVDAYAESQDPIYLENIHARELTSAYNLKRAGRYLDPGARLLDVGSHCGAFLKIAQSQGFNVTGVEPSQWAVAMSAQITDARVIQGALADMPRQTPAYQVVTLWDVLEHFADPLDELRRIHDLLTAEGLLLLSTLDIDNWFPRFAGRHWPWFMDMHLFYFNRPVLTDMLHKAGFQIVTVFDYCHIITLAYLLRKLQTLGLTGAGPLARIADAHAWGRVTIPFKFGDIKLFVCRKVSLVN